MNYRYSAYRAEVR